MKSNRWKVIAAAVLVTAAGLCYIRGADRGGPASDGLLLPAQESNEEFYETLHEEGDTKSLSGTDSRKLSETEEAGIWVHVCGEVRAPGVYELAAGSRVYQAVEAAGGFTEAAGRDYLNMAQTLEDGMKLEIPDLEAVERMREAQNSARAEMEAGAGNSSVKVNINTASREELMTLKGVGSSRADDIIAYREAHGAFQKIEDIMKVSGIKEASFEKIKEDITV